MRARGEIAWGEGEELFKNVSAGKRLLDQRKRRRLPVERTLNITVERKRGKIPVPKRAIILVSLCKNVRIPRL